MGVTVTGPSRFWVVLGLQMGQQRDKEAFRLSSALWLLHCNASLTAVERGSPVEGLAPSGGRHAVIMANAAKEYDLKI